MKSLIIILCLFFVFGACDRAKQNQIANLYTVTKNTLGSTLELPEVLSVYNPFYSEMNSIQMGRSKLKIYINTNASCGTCISELDSWRLFSNDFSVEEIDLIVILHSDDNFETFKYICESGGVKDFPYPFYFDEEEEYLKLNPFMAHSKEFETVLTDQDNKILLIGNPIYNSKTRELYLKVINGEIDINALPSGK